MVIVWLCRTHHTSPTAHTVNQDNLQEELKNQLAEKKHVLAEASANHAKPF